MRSFSFLLVLIIGVISKPTTIEDTSELNNAESASTEPANKLEEIKETTTAEGTTLKSMKNAAITSKGIDSTKNCSSTFTKFRKFNSMFF